MGVGISVSVVACGPKPEVEVHIGFSYAKGWSGFLSRLIMFMSQAPCSHAWLVYRDAALGLMMVMEAHETQYRSVPLPTFARKNTITALFEPRVALDVGIRLVAKELGAGYDFTGLFGMAFVALGRRIKRRFHNPLNSSRALFCSEAVAVALQASGYPNADQLVPAETTPGDLFDFMCRDGARRVCEDALVF